MINASQLHAQLKLNSAVYKDVFEVIMGRGKGLLLGAQSANLLSRSYWTSPLTFNLKCFQLLNSPSKASRRLKQDPTGGYIYLIFSPFSDEILQSILPGICQTIRVMVYSYYVKL